MPAEILLINLRLVQHTRVDKRVIVHVSSVSVLLYHSRMIVTVLWGIKNTFTFTSSTFLMIKIALPECKSTLVWLSSSALV